jgi:hypothetical protein
MDDRALISGYQAAFIDLHRRIQAEHFTLSTSQRKDAYFVAGTVMLTYLILRLSTGYPSFAVSLIVRHRLAAKNFLFCLQSEGFGLPLKIEHGNLYLS